jgi:hypothetical protein
MPTASPAVMSRSCSPPAKASVCDQSFENVSGDSPPKTVRDWFAITVSRSFASMSAIFEDILQFTLVLPIIRLRMWNPIKRISYS